MLLVAVLVVAITGFASDRLHGIFGSHTNTSANAGLSNEIVPFNPKQVILEVFGAPGAVATINYLDVNAQPQQVVNVPLPWTFMITTTEPAVVGNVVAQGNGDTLGCTTIGLGLLFDTLIVRSFMTPSVATLLGRWFWWPQRVRPRPASTMLRPRFALGSGRTAAVEAVVTLCLVKDEPTVCDQCLSGECGRAVGNEEGHRSRRVGRRQPALEGLPLNDGVELDVGIGRARARCVGETGSDRGHRDAVRAKRARQSAREPDNRAFAGDVGHQHRCRRLPERVRGEKHDPAEPTLSHAGRERLRQPECRLDVDRLDAPPRPGVEVGQGRDIKSCRCVNKHVAAAEPVQYLGGGTTR
jgi:hypothetical protein